MLGRMRAYLLFALALAACGPAASGWPEAPRQGAEQPSRPVAQFPEASRVELVLTGEVPDLGPLLPGGAVHVDEWVVESEPALGDPVYEPGDDPIEALLDRAAAERGVALRRSASLRCVARELARFHLRHDGGPTDRLTRFVLAACGATGLDLHHVATAAPIPESVPLERVAAESETALLDMLRSAVQPDRLHGLGVVRERGKIGLVAVTAEPIGELAPWGPPNELGEVHIRGRVTAQGHALVAFVNQGAFGVLPCRAEPTVSLPDIDLRCPMAEGDETAFVNLEMLTLGRVLMERVGVLMLRRDGARPTFRAPSASAHEAVDAATLLARLNEVRAQAGRAPLTLAPSETEAHTRAAPFAVAAMLSNEVEAQEVLSLGMMAGWQVEGGTIRRAHHLTELELGTRSPAHWVSGALEQPVGRLVLLSPDVRQVAIGPVSVEDPPALAVAVSTYAFFEGTDHAADADRLFARIERERTARGLPPPERLRGLDALEAQAAQVSQGAAQPSVAFRVGLDQDSRRHRRSLAGLQLEAVDLDHTPLPDEFFARRDLTLGVVVGHVRAQGAAWGQYVVYFVFPR